jgi:hypothetical protein
VTCPYCGHPLDAEEEKLVTKRGFVACPECHREGCSECMPAGRGVLCPECEEAR